VSILGIDYSWDRPDPHCLTSAGYRFVCRYLSYDETGKNLTAREAGALHSAGLDIVLNWEWKKYDALEGYDLGGRQARDADAFSATVGFPGNSVIYFSLDFDVQPHQYAAVGEYFRAVNKVLGPSRVGVYGGIHIVDYLYHHQLSKWFWQTYAWSGTAVHAQAHIYQYSNGHVICGARSDLDKAMKPQFGQWPGAGSSQVIVPPAPADNTTSAGFDYAGEISATAANIVRLGTTLDTHTSVINALRNN
jgi:hypothetical protein